MCARGSTGLPYGKRRCSCVSYSDCVAVTSSAYTPTVGTLVPAAVLVRVYEYAPVTKSVGPLVVPEQRMVRLAAAPRLPLARVFPACAVTAVTTPVMLTISPTSTGFPVRVVP